MKRSSTMIDGKTLGRIVSNAYDKGRRDGIDINTKADYKEAFNTGFQDGYDEGHDDGYFDALADIEWENETPDEMDGVDTDGSELDWENDEPETMFSLNGMVFGYTDKEDREAMLSYMNENGYDFLATVIEDLGL